MLANLFNKKRKAARGDDKIWLTRAHKYRGLGQWLTSAERNTALFVLVAHFSQTFKELEASLTSQGIPFESFATPFDRSLLRSKILQPEAGAVLLVSGAALPEPVEETQVGIAPKDVTVQIVGLERYPVPAGDKRLEDLADSLPVPTQVGFLGALDDPLLRLFGSETITQLMHALQIPEDEYLSAGPVTKSMQQAQARIAKRTQTDLAASSAEEWFLQNLPGAHTQTNP